MGQYFTVVIQKNVLWAIKCEESDQEWHVIEDILQNEWHTFVLRLYYVCVAI